LHFLSHRLQALREGGEPQANLVQRAFLFFYRFISFFFLFEEAAHTMGGCNCSREEERKLMVSGEEGAFGT
jgi:hypothetical protein